MSSAFDGNTYRKKVLAVLASRGPEELFADPFLLVDLPLDAGDGALIAARVEAVFAFWQRERNSPKYGNLVSTLLAGRDEVRAALLDPAARHAVAGRIANLRAETEAARFARLDGIIRRLVARDGGVPAAKLDQLRRIARGDGLTDSEFDQRIASVRIVQQAPDASQPLAPAVRAQIRQTLTELARLRAAAGDRTSYRTLYDVLGASSDAPLGRLRQRHAAQLAENRRRRHDREKALVDDLLAFVSQHVLDGGQAYRSALVADAKDGLRAQVQQAVLVDDRVTAAEFERLVRQAVALGLDAGDARRVVTELAHEEASVVEVGAAVDYVTCPSCGTVEAAGGRTACRDCGTALYAPCPSCAATIEAAAATCPRCATDLRAVRRARQEVAVMDAALEAGLPGQARERLRQMDPALANLPEVRAAGERLDQVWRVAQQQWQALRDAYEANRLDDAWQLTHELGRTARDVLGPEDTALADVITVLERWREAYRASVADALQRDGADREARLLGILVEEPSCRAALAALAEIPVAAPSRLTARFHEGSVHLSWRASASPGTVRYRVTRHSGEQANGQRVADTSATSLEDVGAAAGSIVSYSVVAVRDRGLQPPSGAVRTRPLVVAGEVDNLTAVAGDGRVTLRWRALPRGADVWVERTEVEARGPAPPQLARAGQDGHVDASARNGVPYRYRVFVEYHPAGQDAVRTEGRVVTAQPLAPPAPVTDLRCDVSGDDLLRLVWTAPAGAGVRIYRGRADPALTPGAPVDLAALGPELRELPVTRAASTVLDTSGDGVRWYLPVTVRDSSAVVGRALRHLGLAPVKDLRAVQEGADAALTWRWPAGCTEARVVYRPNTSPSGPLDPLAIGAKVTNMAYDLQGGWRRELGVQPARYVFAVYPGVRASGALVWDDQPAPTATLRWATPTVVTYRVRRQWSKLRVDVTAQGGPLPELLLVARPGTVPPSAPSDGRVLARVPRGDRRATLQATLTGLSLPTTIGLFLANRAEAPAATITDLPEPQRILR